MKRRTPTRVTVGRASPVEARVNIASTEELRLTDGSKVHNVRLFVDGSCTVRFAVAGATEARDLEALLNQCLLWVERVQS